MKKVIAVILTLIIALSASVMVFAQETTTTQKYWTCPTCNKVFDNITDYNAHLDTHSTQSSSGIVCPICSYKCVPTGTMSAEEVYNEHLDSHKVWSDKDGLRRFQCSNCNKRYENPEELVKCENSHITMGDLSCPECGYKAHNLYDYNDHLNKFHGPDQKYNAYFGEGTTIMDIMNQFIAWIESSKVMDMLLEFAYQIFDLIMAGAKEPEVAGAMDNLEGAANKLNLSLPQFSGLKDWINAIKLKIKSFYAGQAETTIEQTQAEAPVDTGSASVGIALFATISVAAAAAYVCSKKKA